MLFKCALGRGCWTSPVVLYDMVVYNNLCVPYSLSEGTQDLGYNFFIDVISVLSQITSKVQDYMPILIYIKVFIVVHSNKIVKNSL